MDAKRRFAEIPSVDRLLANPAIAPRLHAVSRSHAIDAIRVACERIRERIREEGLVEDVSGAVEREVLAELDRGDSELVPRVVNATGVVLHTNLGRARLPDAAVEAVVTAARYPVSLELDLTSGRRGERGRLVEEDLLALTGAEAAAVVNNNAAGILLALSSLSEGREVIVSRGELIEIGGAFRLPDVLAKSGARLREVGTTNRTHLADYERAIGPRTGLLLKVHTSNYRIAGFRASVGLEQLVGLGRRRGVPIVEDLGSGALIDLEASGLPREPVVAERVALGADVVAFSGDKLLGGPQAGILVGRTASLDRIRENPLRRALRVDKLTLAALAAVLRMYRRDPDVARSIPTLAFLTRPIAELEEIGRQAIRLLEDALDESYSIDLVESVAEVGSGALPTASIQSLAIAVRHPDHSPGRIAEQFRRSQPAILGRIESGTFLLDLRAVDAAGDLVPT